MRKGFCVYYNGLGLDRGKLCDAGVDMRRHVGGSDFGIITRLPCISANKQNPCDKYREPTTEELAEHERLWQAAQARIPKIAAVMAEVKGRHKGQDAKGGITCPECGGTLFYTHAAYNGHVWGKCEKEGCLSWME